MHPFLFSPSLLQLLLPQKDRCPRPQVGTLRSAAPCIVVAVWAACSFAGLQALHVVSQVHFEMDVCLLKIISSNTLDPYLWTKNPEHDRYNSDMC